MVMTVDRKREAGKGFGRWWRRWFVGVAVTGALFLPGNAHAGWFGRGRVKNREEETKVQVVLPSERAQMQRREERRKRAERGEGSTVGVLGRRLGKVGLGLGVVIGVVEGVKFLGRRWQRQQLREFQRVMGEMELGSFGQGISEGLKDGRADKGKKAEDMAREFLERRAKKYRFRKEANLPKEDLAARVKLDLFQSGSKTTEQGAKGGEKVGKEVSSEPVNDFEKAVLGCVKEVEQGTEAQAAVAKMLEDPAVAAVSSLERRALFNSYASRIISATVDKAGALIDSDASESLRILNSLVKTLTSVKAVSAADGGKSLGLSYVGAYAQHTSMREELYRRYAVFCLSSQDRIKENLQSLIDMQALLSISDERAEVINTDIAKGMFQVAVSAAMADGSLNEQSRTTLDELKRTFGDFLDSGSADSIMSEVAVMRAMYALQALLKEQGVSEEDVIQLRKMCSELGVDIDEMMQNADALGAALGPEAKQFVESLRSLLSNAGPSAQATDVNAQHTPASSSASSTTSSSESASSTTGPLSSDK